MIRKMPRRSPKKVKPRKKAKRKPTPSNSDLPSTLQVIASGSYTHGTFVEEHGWRCDWCRHHVAPLKRDVQHADTCPVDILARIGIKVDHPPIAGCWECQPEFRNTKGVTRAKDPKKGRRESLRLEPPRRFDDVPDPDPFNGAAIEDFAEFRHDPFDWL